MLDFILYAFVDTKDKAEFVRRLCKKADYEFIEKVTKILTQQFYNDWNSLNSVFV